MGQCKYCGEDAGLFSHVHKECEEKHIQGIATFENGIRRYFKDAIKMNELKQLSQKLRQLNFLTDPDIAISSAKCIDEYIRRSKDQWLGLRAQQTDASFCQFESMEYGWRAAFYLLTRTYYHKYRLYTIRMIINKWAPPNENLTATYIQNVSRLTGIAPDEPIGIPSDQPQRWMAVGMAMAIQENGTDSLDYFAMLRGWGMCRPCSASASMVSCRTPTTGMTSLV